MITSSELIKNLSCINIQIIRTSHNVGRNPDEISIIAITKTLPENSWNLAIKHGLTKIGESRIQEAESKHAKFVFRNKIELHLIGHLQKNKVRKAIKIFDIIQTVDSITLASRINKIAYQENKKQKIFLQTNTGQDPQKYGFTNDINTIVAAKEISKMSNICLIGIMTIPPQNISEIKLKSVYTKTRKIRDIIKQKIDPKCKFLSMGMSKDFETAIVEGATHLRIGTALFKR